MFYKLSVRSDAVVEGVAKVIDELGLMILQKDIELELRQEEIDTLRRKIEVIEQYINMYEDNCKYDFLTKE